MTGVDIDPGKLEMLRRGQAPIVETGIQELTRSVMRGGTVTVTDSVRDAILATDVSFVCVGTPARANGNQDLDAITRIAEQIGAVLPEKSTRHVIVDPLDGEARHARGSHPARARSRVGPARPGAISVCASSRSSCAKAPRSTTTTIRR